MTETPRLVPVEDALHSILRSAHRVEETEAVPLRQAAGRTLASDLAARRTQPPVNVSAMDGYAVRAQDLGEIPARLKIIGESAAGRGFGGEVAPGQAVRIFTGAPVPAGADSVLIQENAERNEDIVVALHRIGLGQHIRRAGQDFFRGDRLLETGRRLGASDVALAAAMNHASVPCVRRPRVAILATGDELVPPGGEPGPDHIVASNHFALAAIVEAAGGEVLDLGIAPDDTATLQSRFSAAQDRSAELLVTLGGASVGDHDLVRGALLGRGMELNFWRIAMRPGKPLMHGHLGPMQVLGLPGNPVSAIVCGLLFVRPLVRHMCGDAQAGADPAEPAILGAAAAGQ